LLLWAFLHFIVGALLGTVYRVSILVLAFSLIFAEAVIVVAVLDSGTLIRELVAAIIGTQLGYALGSAFRIKLISSMFEAVRREH